MYVIWTMDEDLNTGYFCGALDCTGDIRNAISYKVLTRAVWICHFLHDIGYQTIIEERIVF